MSIRAESVNDLTDSAGGADVVGSGFATPHTRAGPQAPRLVSERKFRTSRGVFRSRSGRRVEPNNRSTSMKYTHRRARCSVRAVSTPSVPKSLRYCSGNR